jgi:RNA polymerase sigma-70 factor (family 1)
LNTIEDIERIWHGKLKIFANAYIHSETTAEDLVQDTFLKLIESDTKITDYHNIGAILFTILKNKCLDYIKHKTVVEKHHESVTENYEYMVANKFALEDDSIRIITRNEIRKALKEAIDKLPEQTRKIFVMNKLKEKKYKEIAQILNISEKTVEYHISKAFSFLRKEMGDYYILALFFFNLQQ